jgi:hypothetical protein
MCATGNHTNAPTNSPIIVQNLCFDFKLKAQSFAERFTQFLEWNHILLRLETT